jgi:hypothetical protein
MKARSISEQHEFVRNGHVHRLTITGSAPEFDVWVDGVVVGKVWRAPNKKWTAAPGPLDFPQFPGHKCRWVAVRELAFWYLERAHGRGAEENFAGDVGSGTG